MAQIDLNHLEAFVAVVEMGTFNRAARRLHLTQPSITSRILNLESGVGVLFTRHPKGSQLTPAGERLYPLAKAILAMTACVAAVANGDMSLGQAMPLAARATLQSTFMSHIDLMGAALENLRNQIEVTLGAPVAQVAAASECVGETV